MRTELLSFTLRRAETHQDLLRACKVRAAAYGYKVPEHRETMALPDSIDASPWTTVFICEDKISGDAVGTMRVQTREHDRGELEMERYVTLPEYLRRATCSEVTRLNAHCSDRVTRNLVLAYEHGGPRAGVDRVRLGHRLAILRGLVAISCGSDFARAKQILVCFGAPQGEAQQLRAHSASNCTFPGVRRS